MVVTVAIAAPVALASDLFSDVVGGNPFHDDINAIALAGITSGCGAGTYCPTANITREAMAAFLRRGLSRVAEGAISGGTSSGTPVLVGSVTIAPGIAATAIGGGTGFIKADAKVVVFLTSPSSSCVCDFGAFMSVPGFGPVEAVDGTTTLYGTLDYATISLTGVIPITGSSPKTVEVYAYRSFGSGTASVFGTVTALYAPFGSTGTNTLSTPALTEAQRIERRNRMMADIQKLRSRLNPARAGSGIIDRQ